MEIDDIDFDQNNIKLETNLNKNNICMNVARNGPINVKQEIKKDIRPEIRIDDISQVAKPHQSISSIISLRDIINVSFLNQCCLKNQPRSKGDPIHLAKCLHLVKARIEVI